MLAIEPAAPADREWCAQLMSGADPWITLRRSLDHCRELVSRPELELLMAKLDGAPCGFLLLHPRGLAGSPYIVAIAVAGTHRGLGIGSRLLDQVERCFSGRARYIFLCVSSFNAGARRLYERRGYTPVGELQDYIIDGASELLMHKRLVAA